MKAGNLGAQEERARKAKDACRKAGLHGRVFRYGEGRRMICTRPSGHKYNCDGFDLDCECRRCSNCRTALFTPYRS